MVMFDTQQKATDAIRAQKQLIRQQEIQDQRDLFTQLIDTDLYQQPSSSPSFFNQITKETNDVLLGSI